MDQSKKRLDIIDQIRDSVSRALPQADPFLHYLPDVLVRPEFQQINLTNTLVFCKYVENNGKSGIVIDALNILNQMVSSVDGFVLQPGPQMFYNNFSFHWKELGVHISAPEVIIHIINKTVFTLSLENTQ